MQTGRRKQRTPAIGLPVSWVTCQERATVGTLDSATPPPPLPPPPATQSRTEAHVTDSGSPVAPWLKSATRRYFQVFVPPVGWRVYASWAPADPARHRCADGQVTVDS